MSATTVPVPIPYNLEAKMAALGIREVRETPDGVERLGRLRYLERNHEAMPTDYVAVCTTVAYRLGKRYPWIAGQGTSVLHVGERRWYEWAEVELAEVLT